MSTSAISPKRNYFTSESVTEGHPDKLCDQVSDAILDACLEQDAFSRVACESAAKTGMILVMGEITTKANLNFDDIIRQTVLDIGYDHSDKSFDGNTSAVQVAISKQSEDIAMGLNQSAKNLGAGDQGMMFGYACDETDELMPLPIILAHKLTRRLAEVRKENILKWAYPDGKSQVTVEYCEGIPVRVDTIIVSTQHSKDVDIETVREGVIKNVIETAVPKELIDKDTKMFVNPTGRFVIGGPKGDAGVTGRKIIVDTYGGMGRHGGGAFSGKDSTKVDRSGAYAARQVAKSVVASKLAKRCEIQISYAIGVARPLNIDVETFGTGSINDQEISKLISKSFDLRPGVIIKELDLRKPIFKQVASYGHFGRSDLDLSWEKEKSLL